MFNPMLTVESFEAERLRQNPHLAGPSPDDLIEQEKKKKKKNQEEIDSARARQYNYASRAAMGLQGGDRQKPTLLGGSGPSMGLPVGKSLLGE